MVNRSTTLNAGLSLASAAAVPFSIRMGASVRMASDMARPNPASATVGSAVRAMPALMNGISADISMLLADSGHHREKTLRAESG